MVRGGAGLYWETELLWRRLRERAAIGPIGNGRLQVPHTSFTNIFPGIVNLNTGQPVPIGASLPASGQLTNMTIGQFMQIYNAQIGGLQAALAPRDATTCRCATSRSARPPRTSTRSSIPVQHALHMSLGIQRELPGNMVLGVEFVRRQLRRHAARLARLEPVQPLRQRRADAGDSALH